MHTAVGLEAGVNTGSAKQPEPNKMTADGLRYEAKKPGSQFGTVNRGQFGGAAMSCFKCGKHRPMGNLVGKKILGKVQRVCEEGCARK